MKATRTMAMAVGAALLATGLFAAPSVEITSVQQQYPWTNTVDIVYTVAGVDSETNGYFVVFTPTTSDNQPIPDVNGNNSIQVALKGSGVYSAQWFPQTNQQYTACKMTPSVFRGAAKDYMIVDLETGAVTYEPMATQEASNQRYSALEYRTTKLVLKRIPAKADYYIGETGNTGNIDKGKNSGHTVSIPQDYYLSIYSMTKAQWNRVTGEGTDYASLYPANATWNVIRGSALSAAVPTSGVMARLNELTGMRGFDLPTESMYEIAARAGCTTVYTTGDTLDSTEASKYSYVADNTYNIIEVGQKLPNSWGFYDMGGNVWHLMRDTWNADDLATLQPNGLVPISTGTSNSAANRGGAAWWGLAYASRPSNRCYHGKTWNLNSRAAIRVSYFPQ